MDLKIYEKYFTNEQLANLRINQVKELKSQEKAMGFNLILWLTSGFWMVVYLIAFFIWYNKVTLFLMVVTALTFVIFSSLHYLFSRTYKKTIKKYKEENHV